MKLYIFIKEMVEMNNNNMIYNQYNPYYNAVYGDEYESTDWDDAYCNMMDLYPKPVQQIISSDELVRIYIGLNNFFVIYSKLF